MKWGNYHESFFPQHFGRKNPQCEFWGRKSTYCDAADYQPTAQQVKSGLNLLPLLLIDNKYIHEVGKLS